MDGVWASSSVTCILCICSGEWRAAATVGSPTPDARTRDVSAGECAELAICSRAERWATDVDSCGSGDTTGDGFVVASVCPFRAESCCIPGRKCLAVEVMVGVARGSGSVAACACACALLRWKRVMMSCGEEGRVEGWMSGGRLGLSSCCSVA